MRCNQILWNVDAEAKRRARARKRNDFGTGDPHVSRPKRETWGTLVISPHLSKTLRSEIDHVDVSSKPHVVGQVVAVMIGVFVDHDVVAIPQPIVAKPDVEVGDAEVEAAEPEPAGDAAGEVPDMAAAKSAGKVAVFPGMIEVVVGIVAAGVVADPLAIGVNVRHVGMARFVAEVPVFFHWMRRAHGRRTAGRNVPAPSMALGER